MERARADHSPAIAQKEQKNLNIAVASEGGTSPGQTDNFGQEGIPVESLIEQYSDLQDSVQRLDNAKSARASKRRPWIEWKLDDILDDIINIDREAPMRLTPKFKVLDRFLEVMQNFAPCPRGSIWPALLFVSEGFRKVKELSKPMAVIFSRISSILERALFLQELYSSREMGRPLRGLEHHFLNIMNKLLRVLRYSGRWRILFQVNDAQSRIDVDLNAMDRCLSDLTFIGETHALAERKVVMETTALVKTNALDTNALMLELRDLLLNTRKVNVQLQPDGRIVKGLTDKLAAYLTAPFIDTLENRRQFLSKKTSRSFIDLFNRPKITSWIASETSAFLWIEAYSNGAPLNFTTEFSLDIIHAGRARGYAVLHHFCELLVVIEDTLHGDEGGMLAKETILKSLLCLAGAQCSQHFVSPVELENFGLKRITELSGTDVQEAFDDCIKSFKADTILYIVIDGVHDLERRVGGRLGLESWLKTFVSLAEESNHVVKLLLTSCRDAGNDDSTFKLWEQKQHNEGQSFVDHTSPAGISSDRAPEASTGKGGSSPSIKTKPPLPRSYVSILKDNESGSTRIFGAQSLLNIKPKVFVPAKKASSSRKATQEPSDPDNEQ